MSAMNDLLIGYMEEIGDYSYPLSEKDLLKFNTQYLVPPAKSAQTLAIAFFESIFPQHDNLKYWMMLIDKKACVNYCYDRIEDFITAYSRYSSLHINAYFSPCLYDGWYVSNNAHFSKVIFIDIDGIESVNLLNMSSEELANWISATYSVPTELLPDWCVCTGHGVHLYYIVNELDYTDNDQSRLRDYYTKMLICYFRADMSCHNRNHILRMPYSHNCKSEVLETKLHRLNNAEYTDISRLDYFLCTDADIEDYRLECNKRKQEKARATRERNGHISMPIQKTPHKQKGKSRLPTEHCVPLSSMEYFKDFNKNSRYWNTIKDLHNYYLRHEGNIMGARNEFIHILSCFLRFTHMSVEEAKDYIEPYCTQDFLAEAQKTVEKAYSTTTIYRYSNETIADLLCFTENDYMQSYCCYREKERLIRKRQSDKRAKDKQLKNIREIRNRTKQGIREYIQNNMNMPTTELAILCGISTRTVQRIKKEIKETTK